MEENIKALSELCNILFTKKLSTSWQKEYANRLGDLFVKYKICEKKDKYIPNKEYDLKKIISSYTYSDIEALVLEYIDAKKNDIKLQKYKILKNEEPFLFRNKKLYKIIALKEFFINDIHIEKDTIGGYIESEDNLSQNDYSWLCEGSIVADNSIIKNDSYIDSGIKIYKNVIIDNSKIIQKIENKGKLLLFVPTIEISNNVKIVKTNIYGNQIFIKNNVSIQYSAIYGENNYIRKDIDIMYAIIRGQNSIEYNCTIEDSKLSNCKLFNDIFVYENSSLIDCVFSESVWIENSSLFSININGNQKIKNKNLYSMR